MINIENTVFKRCHVDIKKLVAYGFQKDKDYYIYSKVFMDDAFEALVVIDMNGFVSGKVIDRCVDEEYYPIRIESSQGAFVNQVRDEYIAILKDIKRHCFYDEYFLSFQANRICNYIIVKYGDEPEFLWEKYSGYGVFRNHHNHKWYGIIMNIDYAKLDDRDGEVEIIDVKVNEDVASLLDKKGIYPAYHMNKKSWITIVLDDTLSDSEIIEYIDSSYSIVSGD